MRKLLILLFTIFLVNKSYSQQISCNDLFEYAIANADNIDVANCYGSLIILKVTRIDVDGLGFVVAYFKRDKYDNVGEARVFCGISQYAWDYFKFEGVKYSWLGAFNIYIDGHKCNCN